MHTTLHGLTPSSSTRLSVNGGQSFGVNPSWNATDQRSQGVVQIAAVRSAVGPLQATGAGHWAYPGN